MDALCTLEFWCNPDAAAEIRTDIKRTQGDSFDARFHDLPAPPDLRSPVVPGPDVANVVAILMLIAMRVVEGVPSHLAAELLYEKVIRRVARSDRQLTVIVEGRNGKVRVENLDPATAKSVLSAAIDKVTAAPTTTAKLTPAKSRQSRVK